MTWCPQCGPEVAVDCDGLCRACGSTATGEGAEHAARLRQELETAVTMRDEYKECLDAYVEDYTARKDETATLRAALVEAVGLLRERVSMCVECRLPCEPCWACRTDAFLASMKEDDR